MQSSNQEPSQGEDNGLRIQEKPLDKQDVSAFDDIPHQDDPIDDILDEPVNEGDL
jgi:hypothetical protein